MAFDPDDRVYDLARLLSPVSVATFFTEHWDQKPLLVRRDEPLYFADLFEVSDLDELLGSFGVPGPTCLRLAKAGGDPPSIDLVSARPPDLEMIHARYLDGYTLNVNDIGARHRAIRRMTHALFADFGVRLRPNLYLSPAETRAFDLHYDTHDVMILQLGGAKEWRVYDRVDEAPTAAYSSGLDIARDRIGEPVVQTTLRAGDFLYVPRGFVHEVHTEGQFSLHLTIGTRMRTYLDVLERMVESAGGRSAKLRASLPPGALLGRSRAEVTKTMMELVLSELEESLVDEATSLLAASELAYSPAVDRPRFVALDRELAPVTLDETLRRPAGLIMALRKGGGRASLHFQSGCFEGPWRVLPALEYIARTEALRARDLPGTLTDDEKLVLARRMVREGLLCRLLPADSG